MTFKEQLWEVLNVIRAIDDLGGIDWVHRDAEYRIKEARNALARDLLNKIKENDDPGILYFI